MKITEIILKLAYLAISAYMLVAGLSHESFVAFILVSILLGSVLLVNTKHPSYTYPANYPYNNRVIFMRRVEGALILAFAAVSLYIAYA